MIAHRVVFGRDAQRQIEELHDYIATAGSPDLAARYTDAIITYCEGLSEFPFRGIARDDIRPGLRTVGFRKRVGGQDYETILGESLQ